MSTYKSWIFLNFQKRGSFTEETHTLYVPKPIQSAPVTPCDSEASTWSDRASSSRQYYELPSTSDNARYDERPSTSDSTRYNVPSTSDKTRYEESMEGVWWWRRPLGVRRNQCRRCGASSATRPLRMMPCAGSCSGTRRSRLGWPSPSYVTRTPSAFLQTTLHLNRTCTPRCPKRYALIES